MRKNKYRNPVIAKVYSYEGKKLRKVAEYRRNSGLERKLGLYAEVMPEAVLYVSRLGVWYRVNFSQEHNDKGELVEWGWDLVESAGIKKEDKEKSIL